MKMLVFFILLIAGMAGYAFWKNLSTPSNIGVIGNKLSDCPKSPNCVSSFGKDEEHYIDPINYKSENPLSLLKSIIAENYEAVIENESDNYFHAVFISKIMRYRDDVEFLVDKKNHLIHVRSASRIGYGDMGANRTRIEQIRRLFTEKDS